MKGLPSLVLAAALAIVHAADAAVAAPAADAAAIRLEFIAAMQRLQLPASQATPASAPPDSQALRSYAIYDYLIAARLRRDLDLHPGDELDAAIDTFLAAHMLQPVSRALRHDWLANLAERRRWDWFLPRSTDVADPSLICDRLQARLDTGDLKVLGPDVMVRWNMPQKQPRECDGVFAWLRQQGLISPALAEVRTRAALAAENPRLARDFARISRPPPPRRCCNGHSCWKIPSPRSTHWLQTPGRRSKPTRSMPASTGWRAAIRGRR